jgi:hypothetical protein
MIDKKIGLGMCLIGIILISMFLVRGIETPGFGAETANFKNPAAITNNPSTYGSSTNPQFFAPGSYGFRDLSPEANWKNYGRETCMPGQDLILQILPGACSPSVVRSDLLEESNVPVFCKVSAIQVNPLIDIKRIRSLRFSGPKPKGVSSITYMPAKLAYRGEATNFQNSVFEDNLGYLVVVLQGGLSEKDMPDFIAGNITATVDYESQGSYGISNLNFYLSELDDSEWNNNYQKNSFWNNKGYLRVDSIEDDKATLIVYRDYNKPQQSVTLKKGEKSNDIFLSGFYCAAGMNLKIEDIDNPTESVLLQVNDQQTWVSKGDKFLDGKCSVKELNVLQGGVNLDIKCSGNDLIELSLSPGKANLSINNKLDSYEIGDNLKDNIFLAYLGKEDKKNYVILINDSYSDTEDSFRNKEAYSVISNYLKENNYDETKIKKEILNQYKKRLKLKASEIKEKVQVEFVLEGEGRLGIQLDVTLIAKNNEFTNKDLKEFYDQSIESYESLIDFYPNEKIASEEDPFAAQALLNAAYLAKKLDQHGDSYDFAKRLSESYPNTKSAQAAKKDNDFLLKHDTNNAKASIAIGLDNYFIDLLDYNSPGVEDLSASFVINNDEYTFALNEARTIESKRFQVIKIDDDEVEFEYNNKKKKIKKDNPISFESLDIKLVDININKQVKVGVYSKGYGPRTESSFSFGVGIEKRAIKLSPEKATEMKENVDGSIEAWTEINEKLGTVVEAMKLTCFGTAGALMLKNLVQGLSGEALARSEIMTGPSGWNEKCGDMVSNGEKSYVSLEDCLFGESVDINKDVQIRAREIEKTNEVIKQTQGQVTYSNPFDIQGQVDYKEANEKFGDEFVKWCGQNSGAIVDLGGSDGTVGFGKSSEVNLNLCGVDNSAISHEQRKSIMTSYNVMQDPEASEVLKDYARRELEGDLRNVHRADQAFESRSDADRIAESSGIDIPVTRSTGDKDSYVSIKSISGSHNGHKHYGHFSPGSNVFWVYVPNVVKVGETDFTSENIKGKNFAVELERNGDYYVPKQEGVVVDSEGNKLGEIEANLVRGYIDLAQFGKLRPSEALKNEIKDTNKLKVKYFENEPYKGLPAEVPFDTANGWYAEMTYILSGFGKPYEESGRVINFWICNAGPNGRIEFKQGQDDICRYYNAYSPSIEFPGLSNSESKKLINDARNAIADAVRQYGSEKVRIKGPTGEQIFNSAISFSGEQGLCSDFMSPSDCYLMFNVCDPVICPASRCDFGGSYRVDNVIQTGIIGSLTLCLPNIQEGIFVPICLSGVHAGIEGWVAVLNQTSMCLQESIDSGRMIGICDEVTSFYTCDFFWKQTKFLTNIIVPRLFEVVFGQGARGGGEYLTVQKSFENTKSAAAYFVQSYAENSVRAFSFRSLDQATTEVGTQVCKSFISTSFGSSSDYLKALIEPDSPDQYHAWFSEDQISSAGVPQSHYKVFFTIYAGKDIGSQYVVYLKDLVGDFGTVNPAGYYTVYRGYLPRGGQVSETRDFVAVSGFKQLCISINGKEKCGFGKVSTSYALDKLGDSYAADQLQANITSEQECVSGVPSIKGLLQPNLQSGIEDSLNSELYNEGIIRVCASANPGKQVLETGQLDETVTSFDKWKDAGHCGDESVRCWIDTDSVKNVIKDTDITQQVLNEIDVKKFGDVTRQDSRVSESVITESKTFIENLDDVVKETDKKVEILKKISSIVWKLTELTEIGYSNNERAEGHLLLGNLHNKITEVLRGVELSNDDKKDKIVHYPLLEVPGQDGPGLVDPNVEGKDEGSDEERLYVLQGDKIFYDTRDTGFSIRNSGGNILIYHEKYTGALSVGGINSEGNVVFKVDLEGSKWEVSDDEKDQIAEDMGAMGGLKFDLDSNDFVKSDLDDETEISDETNSDETQIYFLWVGDDDYIYGSVAGKTPFFLEAKSYGYSIYEEDWVFHDEVGRIYKNRDNEVVIDEDYKDNPYILNEIHGRYLNETNHFVSSLDNEEKEEEVDVSYIKEVKFGIVSSELGSNLFFVYENNWKWGITQYNFYDLTDTDQINRYEFSDEGIFLLSDLRNMDYITGLDRIRDEVTSYTRARFYVIKEDNAVYYWSESDILQSLSALIEGAELS